MRSEESILARMISKITEPQMVLMAMGFVGAWHAGLRRLSYGSHVLFIVSIGVLVTVARVRLMRVLRTNWDVSNRKKRVRVLLYFLLFSIGMYGTIWIWRNPALVRFYGLFLLWFTGFFFITLKMKISGHVAVFVLALGLLAYWYEFSLWVLAVLIPLIGWSRVKLKRHTLIEVLSGALYSIAVLAGYARVVRL